MEKRKSNLLTVLLAVLLIGVGSSIASWLSGRSNDSVMAAAMPSISGTVKDDAGKPVRGAVVSATSGSGFKRVSSYTNAAGQYKITDVKPDTYQVSATGWGLETKEINKNLTGDMEVNFTLAPKWDPDVQMSWAEWLTFLPNTLERVKMEGCVGCHNLSWILRDRGMRGATAEDWKVGLASMARKLGRFGEADPEVFATLEKYFGPNAKLPTMDQVQHVEMSDAALRATWREYRPPTVSNLIHSADADANGQIWFAMWDRKANKVGRLDPRTDEIQEIPVPTPSAGPHTPLFDSKDGMMYVTQGAINSLGMIDPRTSKYTEFKAPSTGSPHTTALDSQGNVWYCDAYGSPIGAKIGRFDIKTQKFAEYAIPVPPLPPDASTNLYWQETLETRARGAMAPESAESGGSQGAAKPKDAYGLYAIGIDSHDNVWVSTSGLGNIIRLDPKTGESKFYPIPGGQHMKGVAVDANDNVWFSSYSGHRLGKITSSGEIKLYQMPTANASTYGIVIDKKRGYLWTPDFTGNHITRLNLRTEEFTEYRFPTPYGMARFIGLDPQGRVVFTESTAGVFGILDPGDTPATGSGPRAAVTSK